MLGFMHYSGGAGIVVIDDNVKLAGGRVITNPDSGKVLMRSASGKTKASTTRGKVITGSSSGVVVR